ncbi:MAG: UvrB/UvrC motif-containing protein [candidate division Zixibacteria bacterium]|nr:UvrB/UvrC motif-containing protein [candidate division Zixibacteria bacterium]
MLCEDCKKNKATIQWTQVINDEKMMLNLCRDCAEKRGFHSPFEEVPFPLAEFLSSMLDKGVKKEGIALAEVKCPNCQMTFAEFSRVGRLGCGSCYTTFRVQLNDLLRKIHGSNRHRGKIPYVPGDSMKPLREERKLQEELKRAVEQEDFEEAARIRDRIKTLLKEKNVEGK